MPSTPARLIYEDGLCRCGCSGVLSRPEYRFRLGHDFHLFDVLLDAHRDQRQIEVRSLDASQLHLVSPDYWALFAFFPRGYRWWRLKSGIENPAEPDEVAGVEDSNIKNLSMGTFTDEGVSDRGPFDSDIAEDLQTIRDVTAKAAESSREDEHRILELESLVRVLREQVIGLQAALQQATIPLNFDQTGLAQLTNEQALRVARSRVMIAAKVLDQARYEGDSGEFWDLAAMMLPTERNPVRVRAARALLGQENP
jgi:hypothetical protein